MKTIVFIILIIMVWKGFSMAEGTSEKYQTPAWLEEWHQEFEEEERVKEKELQQRYKDMDLRKDEGQERNA